MKMKFTEIKREKKSIQYIVEIKKPRKKDYSAMAICIIEFININLYKNSNYPAVLFRYAFFDNHYDAKVINELIEVAKGISRRLGFEGVVVSPAYALGKLYFNNKTQYKPGFFYYCC